MNFLFFSFKTVSRLEAKEEEMKKEYAKLHERYTELFKTHMDCMERTKILMGSGDRVDLPGRTRMTSIPMSHLNRWVEIISAYGILCKIL